MIAEAHDFACFSRDNLYIAKPSARIDAQGDTTPRGKLMHFASQPMRRQPVCVRIVDVRGWCAKVNAIDSGDAITLDYAGALRRTLRRNSIDEHAERIARCARRAKLDTKSRALRHCRVHSQKNPVAECRVSRNAAAEHTTFNAPVRVLRACGVGLSLDRLCIECRRR